MSPLSTGGAYFIKSAYTTDNTYSAMTCWNVPLCVLHSIISRWMTRYVFLWPGYILVSAGHLWQFLLEERLPDSVQNAIHYIKLCDVAHALWMQPSTD